ncbi:60S ribosome biogenesis protein [Grosmannia clavigera kw1407]|uniref:60S ribosome biogenesis protein n=1 Tax=Grosmannia clavigera (strain kw1407 / UAMH 11150) TaxID=655863 RepID=F0XK99_GROCL|nr:60S ribosome biogenesis protein [Grosmannia clavigera kw1407]EFX01906.1 60S ribosome biogenesis protein [Grosmannia clavigera kw1407]
MAPPRDHHEDEDDSEPELLAAEDAMEEIGDDDGDDVAMDSGADDDDDEMEELLLVNDSIAYFDAHRDSVFAIAQHPRYPSLVATGGSEGDGDDAPGKGYVVDTSAAVSRPVLPPSFSSDPAAMAHRSVQLEPVFAIDGHTDSINTLAFTQPNGDFLVSGGLDGRMRVYSVAVRPSPDANVAFRFVAEAQEVPEINWLAACPAPAHPNTIALGASDGSVWVYTIDNSAADPAAALQIVQSYFLHTASCTAGVWSPDGQLLATVSEDSSLHVWDVWGAASAKGITSSSSSTGGQTVVSLTATDQRFEVDGGLFSVAISPGGGVVAVGGAGGLIKIVGLPRLSGVGSSVAGGGAGGKTARSAAAGRQSAAAAQAGTILASLQVQSDGVETLAFAPPPLTLLAAGSVDGSVTVYDASRSFAVRRHIAAAHDEFSVVKVEWVRSPPIASASASASAAAAAAGPAQWLLTSCGMDGVVRRWDLRANAAASVAPRNPAAAAAATAAQPGSGATPAGLVREWRGHRGDGEGGGVLGFVQGETGERVITAGDDGVVLVFEA